MYTLCSLIYFYTSNLQIGFFYPHQKNSVIILLLWLQLYSSMNFFWRASKKRL